MKNIKKQHITIESAWRQFTVSDCKIKPKMQDLVSNFCPMKIKMFGQFNKIIHNLQNFKKKKLSFLSHKFSFSQRPHSRNQIVSECITFLCEIEMFPIFSEFSNHYYFGLFQSNVTDTKFSILNKCNLPWIFILVIELTNAFENIYLFN